MYVDIFDGVWNVGFINHDTGAIEPETESSLYSNSISIKKKILIMFSDLMTILKSVIVELEFGLQTENMLEV